METGACARVFMCAYSGGFGEAGWRRLGRLEVGLCDWYTYTRVFGCACSGGFGEAGWRRLGRLEVGMCDWYKCMYFIFCNSLLYLRAYHSCAILRSSN
jgi:hypothetical protein